jgi:hypothetical protein
VILFACKNPYLILENATALAVHDFIIRLRVSDSSCFEELADDEAFVEPLPFPLLLLFEIA